MVGGARQGCCGVVGGVPAADRCVGSGDNAAGVKEVLMFSIGGMSVWSTAMITLCMCVAVVG